MTREQYDELSAPLLRVINDMEDDILRLIAAQLAKDGDFSDTSKWRMRQLARAGKLDRQTASIIAKYTGIQSDLLAEAVEIAALTEISYVDNAVADLQRQGFLAGVPELPAEKSAADAYKAFQAQAQSDLNLVNTVMQYKARSSFVAAVNAAYHESQKSRQAALDVMGKHSAAAAAGHMSLQEATRRCIRQLAERGIPAFVDKAGREWSPEAYVMMDMRSTLGNTARAAQDMRCDKYGFKLIEVSSYMGARPKCAKDQGKIYSRDGSRGVTMDGRGDKIYFTPLSETSYGEPDGLFGINCSHVQYPYAEGCSFQRYFSYPEEENSKRYKQFQQQRYLERQVRTSKRECMMLNETGDKEGFAKASARLKARKKQYSDYCNKTGLKMHNDRTQVYGFDRSVSGKVTSTYKQLLTWGNGDVTIGLKVQQFKADLKSGKIITSVDIANQSKHLNGKVWKNQVKQAIGSNGKITPRSKLAKDLDPQKLIDKYAGTGSKYQYMGNNKYPDEYITLPFTAGVTFNKKTGKYEKTNRIQIKYNEKKGIHVFPVLEKK